MAAAVSPQNLGHAENTAYKKINIDLATMESPEMNEQLVNIPNAGQIAALLSEREGRGIQGLFHSTAVDTTLYSLFTFNSTLDGLLRKTDVVEDVQRSLRDGIVTPLRTQHAVGAKRVVQFRLALMKACSLGARSLVEETDPMRFIDWLLNALRSPPLLNIRHLSEAGGSAVVSANHVDLTLKYKEGFLYNVAGALENALVERKARIAETPSTLVLNVRREPGPFGELAPILPAPHIDLTNALYNVMHKCAKCGKSANKAFECSDDGGCFNADEEHMLLAACTYCSADCFQKAHEEMHRPHHRSVLVQLAQQSSASASVSMELFAVLCKGLFGYVAYVRLPQSSPDAQPHWVFFNPMDHSEEDSQGGHNVPIVKPAEKLHRYLLNDPNILEGAIEKTPADQKRLAQEGVVYFYRRPAASASASS